MTLVFGRTPELHDAWGAAALELHKLGRDTTPLTMAADGHENARAYVADQLEEAEDMACPCGADELCSGVTLPDRSAYAGALRKLLAWLDAEGA